MKFRQEPLVNVRHLVNLVDIVAAVESSRNGENALIRWINQFLINILHILVLPDNHISS